MQETRVWALGWEDPPEKEMATHSSTIAWKIPWTEEPGRLQSMGLQRVRHDWVTSLSLSGRYYKCQNNHQIKTHMTQKLELSEMKSKRIMITMLKTSKGTFFLHPSDVYVRGFLLYPTLCNPIDCSLPGFSVHGIIQAIVLEWIAISFSRGSSQPRARTRVSHIVDRLFTIWATREVNDISVLSAWTFLGPSLYIKLAYTGFVWYILLN